MINSKFLHDWKYHANPHNKHDPTIYYYNINTYVCCKLVLTKSAAIKARPRILDPTISAEITERTGPWPPHPTPLHHSYLIFKLFSINLLMS